MEELARKLINVNREETASSSGFDPITGRAGNLSLNLSSSSGPRIGLWPIVSETHPREALGITVIAALLLERWTEITVYRLLSAVHGESTNYEWQIADSQFTVDDDWELEGLDDNIGLWGTLTVNNGSWKLILELENDLDEKETIDTFIQDASSFVDLLNKLPALIERLVETTSINKGRVFEAVYPEIKCSDDTLQRVVYSAFEWELMLYLHLWGRGDEIKKLHEQLIDQCRSCGDFGAWLGSAETARAYLPGFREISDKLLPVETLLESYPQSRFPRLLLARALYDSGVDAKRAFDLLEEELELRPEYPVTWRTLANIYSRSGRVDDTIDTLQAAIEEEAINAPLLLAYSQYLYLVSTQGWNVEELIFVEPDEIDDRPVFHEIVAAYDKALELEPDNAAEILALKLRFLSELNDIDRLWPTLDKLLEEDKEGNHLRSSIEDLYNVEDLSEGINVLRRAISNHPGSAPIYMSLAAIYILDEQGEEAIPYLNKARSLTEDEGLLGEIDRLMLWAEDPDFEMVMGDITDKISANSRLLDEDIEYLEDVIAEAPKYTEAYILLARAYMLEDDASAALETLLDAEKNITDEPEIFELLATLLWDSNERDLAFQYIARGLKLNQSFIPLLALAGQYLFDEGEDDTARAYLARAEALAPEHPALLRVKKYIASKM